MDVVSEEQARAGRDLADVESVSLRVLLFSTQ
jgi:hypothetical protein